MELGIYGVIVTTLKLTLALSPLIVIVCIFVKNKNTNQRSIRGAMSGVRVDYVDSDFEDEKKDN